MPQSWYRVPSSASDMSFVVRGRGDRFRQRRVAPFSPRAGHAQCRSFRSLVDEVFIGGRNATHYIGDAWLRLRSRFQQDRDSDWYRLPTPPFTPRADVQVWGVPPTSSLQVWYVAGGQTAHHCGLWELGVCSDEVWQLTATFYDSETSGASFNASWSAQPVARLPNTHCGAAIQWSRNDAAWLFGGQHSYNDSSCSSAPIYSNEVWASTGALTGWVKADSSAPFSPRRFLIASDSQIETPLSAGPIIGAVRSDSSSESAALRVASVILLADVWSCYALSCRSWLALAPTAGGHSQFGTFVPALHTLDFPSSPSWWGGYTSRAFLEQYRNTVPLLTAGFEANLSELTVNLTMTITGPPEGMFRLRARLPVNTTLSEAEINDPHGEYTLGSTWQQWSMPFGDNEGLYFTLHQQPYAFADHRDNATYFLPQAASSLNTSRPALNFPLRRLDGRLSHRTSPPTISGGHSGDHFFNDVLEYDGEADELCWPGSDPSYRAALGPIEEWLSGQPGQARARCPSSYHWEPPLLDEVAHLICAPNGMWMDATALTIRRCVRDTLACPFPLQDLGGEQCEPVLPVIESVHASYIGADGETVFVDQANAWTLVDAPLLADVRLTIVGPAFFEPVQVQLGGVTSVSAELVEPGRPPLQLPSVCYNVTESEGGTGPTVTLCSRYATSIVCTLSALLGVRLEVQVATGRLGAVTKVSEMARRLDITAATVSTMAPQLLTVEAAECYQDDHLRLSSCPISSAFDVTVCASAQSVGDLKHQSSDVAVTMRTRGSQTLACSSWYAHGAAACTDCVLEPWLFATSVMLQRRSTNQSSASVAAVTFRSCSSGARDNPLALLEGDFSHVCIPCEAGWSTNNISGTDCVQCPPGFFTSQPGSPMCSPCQPGHYASQYNSSTCASCPLNSYSNSSARSICETCELNSYIVYDDPALRGVAGHCQECPAGTSCFANGTVVSARASYLLIDQQAGTVSSVPCSLSACVIGVECMDGAAAATPVIASSGLPVFNCCGAGRWPPHVADFANTPLADSHGFNVLCAACLPGYSSVSGRCIPCASTNRGAVLGVCVLALLLVYLVHRLPHDWTGSATLLITAYFLQQSALFLAADSLPQVLTLINMDLLGSHVSRGSEAAGDDTLDGYAGVCVVPLGDVGRIVLALVSPLIAFALLAVVTLLDGAAWAVVFLPRAGSAAAGDVEPTLAQRAYRWVFLPSTPKLLFAGQASGVRDSSVSPFSSSLLADADVDVTDDDGSLRSRSSLSSDSPLLPPPTFQWRNYQRTCIRLVQLSYTSLSVTTLSFFHLQSVGSFGQRVVDYPTLSPQSAEYRALLPVIVCLLAVVVCGLPVLLTVWLWFEHRRGTVAEAKQAQREGAGVTVSTRQAALLQLCAMYRPEHWWMAPFVLVRRLLLVALLVAVRGSAVWIWLSMANYCLLALHAHVQPYARRLDNTMESLTLLSLSVQTTLLSVWPPPYWSRELFGVLNSLVVAPLIPLLVVVLSAHWRQYQAKQRRTALLLSERDDGQYTNETM